MEKVILESNYPIASDSLDHLYPFGTAKKSPVNGRFIDKIGTLFSHIPFTELAFLDLGCGGGHFVEELLDRGHIAIGLEGSDFSKKRNRGAWKFFSDQFLFTCDITKPFHLTLSQENKRPTILFDLITAWEVMEHIPEEKIDAVIENIKKHLKPLGLVIFSISNDDSIHLGHNLHVCKKSKSWWIEKFQKGGLYHLEEYKRYFNDQFIVGPKQVHHGFNLILSPDRENYLKPPQISLKERFLDKWFYSKLHYKLAKVLAPTD